MVAPASWSGGLNGLSNSASQLSIQLDLIMADVGKVVREVNDANNEEISTLDKQDDKLDKEKTIQDLMMLKTQLQLFPTSVKGKAEKIVGLIDEALRKLGANPLT